MLIGNEDGSNTAGPLDVLCILHDAEGSKRFHPAFIEERPMPGPIQPPKDMTFARMESKMHHTGGFATLEEAQASLRDDLSKRILCRNVIYKPIPWDGVPFVCIWPMRDGNLDIEGLPSLARGK